MRATLIKKQTRPDHLLRLFIIVLGWLAGQALAAPPPPYVIDSVDDQARITIYSEYLIDTERSLTLTDLRSGDHDDRFIPARHGFQRLGFHRHPVWLRFALRNSTGINIRRILELSPGLAASLVFYEPTPAGYVERHSGTSLSVPWADLRGREQLYLLELPAGESRLYYLRLEPSLALGFSLHLHPTQEQAQRQAQRDLPYIAMGGLIIGLLILSGALWLVNRQRLFLYFVLCQGTTLAAMAASAGFLGAYWFTLPDLQPRAETFLELLAISFSALFSREFLKPGTCLPRVDLLLKAITLITAGLALFSLSLHTLNAGLLAYSSSLVTALAFAIVGMMALYTRLPHAGLFLVARGALLIAVVVTTLAVFGLLRIDLPLSLVITAALAFETVLFSYGMIIHREQHLREDMTEYQKQVLQESLWQARTDTLARVSHEIRTPMSGILGMAELLEDTPLTPNQKECVRSIQSAGENLLRIINDVLEYSRIEQEGSNLNQETFDPGELAMDTLELFRERAEEKQIELVPHIHSNVPSLVRGDSGRLRQVLTNILAACVRHGSAGELVVDVIRDPSGRADHLRFQFEGSALKHLDHHLSALQEKHVDVPQQDSTTLGLSIARQLVEAMKGRCGAHEGRRQGQFCWISVPLPAAESEEQEPDDEGFEHRLVGRHMLVVDDSVTVTRVIRHQALSWGMRVTVCHDPREALASIRMQANIKDPYDIVLLDHLMPGMSGMQLASRIHEDLVISHPLVLVMLTGVQDAPTANLARNAGIHKVLIKPVSGRRLRRALVEALDMLGTPVEAFDDTRMPDPSLRILVAEDHVMSQKVIRGMLAKLNLDADIVNNGLEALAAVQEKDYDLILMDCEMPEMDGFEAARRIRALDHQRGRPPVPIVALTAHVLREHRERSFEAGMNDHVSKPVELTTLAAVIVRFTRSVDDTVQATDQTSAETPE